MDTAAGSVGQQVGNTPAPLGETLDPTFLTCCPVGGPFPTPQEPPDSPALLAKPGVQGSLSLVSPPNPRLIGRWDSSSSLPWTQHA